jgi:hypothetical protein
MASRFAICAIFGKVPPKVMPGNAVCTSPVMLRIRTQCIASRKKAKAK